MPRRSNLFQDVVAIIHSHMAEDAEVEESALLTNRVTGAKREVDVVISSQAAGHDFVVAVEASARSRRASAEWVEQMLGKHENLPTDKLVLVSEGGFTPQALSLAAAHGVVALAPEDVSDEDPSYAIVNHLRSVWPKAVSLTPERAQVFVQPPGEEDVRWFRAPYDLKIFLDDGQEVGTLLEIIKVLIRSNMPTIAEQIGLGDIAESMDAWFTLDVGPPWRVNIDGVDRHLYVRWEEDGKTELHLIDHLAIVGKAKIDVTEISLTHQRLGEVMYSYGEGDVAGRQSLLLFTEGEAGGQGTVRVRPERPGLSDAGAQDQSEAGR